jgi:hypothetical protein
MDILLIKMFHFDFLEWTFYLKFKPGPAFVRVNKDAL